MRRALIVFALLASTAQGQRLYHLSVGAQVAAQGMDVASSWGGIEANPMLWRGQRYAWKATAL